MKKLIITTVALAAFTFGACKKDNLQPTANNGTLNTNITEQEANNDKVVVPLFDKLLKIDFQKTKTILSFSSGEPSMNYSNFSLKNCPYIMKFTDGSTKIVSTYFRLSKDASSSTQKIRFFLNDWSIPFSTNTTSDSVNYSGNADRSFWESFSANLSKTGTNTFSVEFFDKSFANSVATNEAKYNVSLVLNPTTKKVTVTIKVKDLIPNNLRKYRNSTRTFAYYIK